MPVWTASEAGLLRQELRGRTTTTTTTDEQPKRARRTGELETGGAYVVGDVERQVHVHGLVVEVVLDGLLARGEGCADLLGLAIGGGRELGVQLGLQRPARTRGNKKRGTDESRLQSV